MEKLTNILIVDDEVLIAEFLKDILLEFGFHNIRLAHNTLQAFIEIEKNKPDLILLDIRMNTKTEGISIAEKINESSHIPFIFITAHSDTTIVEKALATNPQGYITKPFKNADVYAAIQLALKNTNKKSATTLLVFKNHHTQCSIPTSSILYAKSEGNYLELVTESRTFSIRYSLNWLIENLPDADFKKVHRSFVVNIKKVTQTNSKSLWIGSIEIPISRNFYFEF